MPKLSKEKRVVTLVASHWNSPHLKHVSSSSPLFSLRADEVEVDICGCYVWLKAGKCTSRRLSLLMSLELGYS